MPEVKALQAAPAREQRQRPFAHTQEKYAIIGAGPSGLAAGRCLAVHGIPFDIFEAAGDVGGLWNIHNPRSTVYESAHLISSKKMTEFSHFPMREEVSDFPHYAELHAYFQDYARANDLYRHIYFHTPVERIEPQGDFWQLRLCAGQALLYRGVIIANGTLSEPNIPDFPGEFEGELLHACHYKRPDIFEGKRVLIVGAGNSGCDIAIDAVHRARSVGMSVRRGYHFVPKYVFGRPADTVGGKLSLPRWLKQRLDKWLLSLFVPNPQKLGFPAPDHRLYESHPIVNSLILHHLGHGDISVWPDIQAFDGKLVRFKDGRAAAFDLVLLATGYRLHYPFIDKAYLNWKESAPELYLNIFHPTYNNLFVMGMVEATGLGWNGRYEQAELIAHFILHHHNQTPQAASFIARKAGPPPDTSGGYRYLKLHRMSYYVHKDTYLKALRKHKNMLPPKGLDVYTPLVNKYLNIN